MNHGEPSTRTSFTNDQRREPSNGRCVVTVIAHPDDDLYFINPDLLSSIRAGEHVVTVSITCGEADGKNFPATDPRAAEAPTDYEGYSAARQHGLLAAYAAMATGDRHSSWAFEPLSIAGAEAQLAVLRRAPHIRIVFLNLWEKSRRDEFGNGSTLRHLWTQETDQMVTLRPFGSEVQGISSYSRRQLIRALVEILRRFCPSVVRTMDPDPDYQIHDALNPQHADYGDFSDHEDHTAAGRFAWAALHSYFAERPDSLCSVQSYRGYFNERWPATLSESSFRSKLHYLSIYGWADGHECDAPCGCGDRKVGGMARGTGWGKSMTYRYQPSTTWLQCDVFGRLVAFSVLNGRIAKWQERAAGCGEWDGPILIDAERMLPYLAVGRDRVGRWLLAGVQATFEANPCSNNRDIVIVAENEPDGGFDQLTILGNPHDTHNPDPVKRTAIGMPALATSEDGMHLFVRNSAGGLSSRSQLSDDSWGPWLDLRGFATQDGLTTVTLPNGHIEVLAATKAGATHWFRRPTDANFSRALLPVCPTAGPPTAFVLPDGCAGLIARQPGTAWTIGYRQVLPGNCWDLQPRLLGIEDGVGPIAAISVEESIILAQRDSLGGVSVVRTTIPSAADALPQPWSRIHGPNAVKAPAIAVDDRGYIVIGLMGTDGRLYIARASRRDELPTAFKPACR